MKYYSTRDTSIEKTASQAILKGISEDGGLFVPENIPQIDYRRLKGLDYCTLAAKILKNFLTDYSEESLYESAKAAYASFNGNTAKTVKLEEGLYSLELWHGPTSAFKDYALQLMPRLLVEAKKINNDTSKTAILVATSGDTGKAALEGYKDLPGIEIAVFYPNNGTSETQRLQMATQEGCNVHVYAVEGNFDDAQTGVKIVFTDKAFEAECAEQGKHLTSANSINWGRLAPQIVYYFASYLKLVEGGEIADGEPVDFCVPTGNFGDILAGYYARCMGLPVRRLICASNKNNILTDFGTSGTYDANRPFYKTSSPSMDILVSSNLERLLFHESYDPNAVAAWMKELSGSGRKYSIPPELIEKIRNVFSFGCADEEACRAEIAGTWNKDHYLADPHTAVGLSVARRLSDGKVPCVVLSTANPYKFSAAVLTALGSSSTGNDFGDMEALEKLTGTKAPEKLSGLREKKIRFTEVIRPSGIYDAARSL